MLRPYRELVATKPAPPPLDDDLRRRLLEIAARRPRPTCWQALTAPIRRPPLWLRSPALTAIASYLLALGLSLPAESPYRLGRQTLEELGARTEPLVARGRDWVDEVRAAGAALEGRLDSTLDAARRQARQTWVAATGDDAPSGALPRGEPDDGTR